MVKVYSRLKEYWNIQKPVYLKHQSSFNGVSITPEHNTKQVLKAQEVIEDVVVITPVHSKGSITRTFGDVLCDEVI